MRSLRSILTCLAILAATSTATADVLVFECVGTESLYTATFEEHQKNLVARAATVRLEVDRSKKTMSVKGTTNADGQGALKMTPASFETSYSAPRTIYEVSFEHVLVYLPQAGNKLTVMAGTHLDLSAPEAEGRLLFSGVCRLPKKG